MSSPKLISGQGSIFKWNKIDFWVTAIQISIDSGSLIDITSMSSRKIPDPENTGREFIEPDWDLAFSGESLAEVSIDFFAEQWLNTENPLDMIGFKRPFELSFPADDTGKGKGFSLGGGTKKAVLKQVSLGVSAGEFVTGSATFRLTGD